MNESISPEAFAEGVSDDSDALEIRSGASLGASSGASEGDSEAPDADSPEQVSTPQAAVPAPVEAVSDVPVNRGGRPRKTILSDAQRALVSALAAKGATVAMVAGQLGMSSTTFRRAMKEDQRTATAFEVGAAQLGVDLVGELVRRALDPKAPQSTIALIFATKALLGFRDMGDPPAAEGSTRLRLELTMPKALPVARYAELVDRARRLGAGAAQAGGDAVVEAEVVR